jgi:hypothetical protein
VVNSLTKPDCPVCQTGLSSFSSSNSAASFVKFQNRIFTPPLGGIKGLSTVSLHSVFPRLPHHADTHAPVRAAHVRASRLLLHRVVAPSLCLVALPSHQPHGAHRLRHGPHVDGFPHGTHHCGVPHGVPHGAIPATLTQLGSITHLNLSSNFLNGEILASIDDLISLTTLDLSMNILSGGILDTVSMLLELKVHDLGSNCLNGSTPFLAEMKGLRELNLENNDFDGAVPFNTKFQSRLWVFKASGTTSYATTDLSSHMLNLKLMICGVFGSKYEPLVSSIDI